MAKLSRKQASAERREYEATHPLCARPAPVHGRWVFCRCGLAMCHEIRHGSGIVYEKPNYYPLAHQPCHMGWAHREQNPPESDGEIMLRMFAVKIMYEEATKDDVARLMRGIQWWALADWERVKHMNLVDRVDELTFEMRSLTDLKHPFGC